MHVLIEILVFLIEMLRQIDTGFDSDSDSEDLQIECTHSPQNTLCAHCQKKLCNQCEFLHKFRIKKEMEAILTSVCFFSFLSVIFFLKQCLLLVRT